MTTIDVQSDVPPPSTAVPDPTGAMSQYPAGRLAVGQSFFVPLDNPTDGADRVRRRIYSACSHARRRQREAGLPVARFVSEVRQENDQPGVRCWRIA